MFWVMFGVLVGAMLAVIFSPFGISADESRQEEERTRKPIDRAAGDPCWICGVWESAHDFITGHTWRPTGGRL